MEGPARATFSVLSERVQALRQACAKAILECLVKATEAVKDVTGGAVNGKSWKEGLSDTDAAWSDVVAASKGLVKGKVAVQLFNGYQALTKDCLHSLLHAHVAKSLFPLRRVARNGIEMLSRLSYTCWGHRRLPKL